MAKEKRVEGRRTEPESLRSVLAGRKKAYDDFAKGKITIEELRKECPPIVSNMRRHTESGGWKEFTAKGWMPMDASSLAKAMGLGSVFRKIK